MINVSSPYQKSTSYNSFHLNILLIATKQFVPNLAFQSLSFSWSNTSVFPANIGVSAMFGDVALANNCLFNIKSYEMVNFPSINWFYVYFTFTGQRITGI